MLCSFFQLFTPCRSRWRAAMEPETDSAEAGRGRRWEGWGERRGKAEGICDGAGRWGPAGQCPAGPNVAWRNGRGTCPDGRQCAATARRMASAIGHAVAAPAALPAAPSADVAQGAHPAAPLPLPFHARPASPHIHHHGHIDVHDVARFDDGPDPARDGRRLDAAELAHAAA